MPNVALIPRAATRIPALTTVVDGYPNTKHKLETTTGGEPIEDGRDVTDHAVAKEERLILTGMVSDFGGGQRPADAWTAVRRLHRDVQTLRVITELGVYPEMIIKRCETNQTGRGLRFTLDLKQLLRVGVDDLTLPAAILEGIMSIDSVADASTISSAAVAQANDAVGAVETAAYTAEDAVNAAAISAGAAFEESKAAIAFASDNARKSAAGVLDSSNILSGSIPGTIRQLADAIPNFSQSSNLLTRAVNSLNNALNVADIEIRVPGSSGSLISQSALNRVRNAIQSTQRLANKSRQAQSLIDRASRINVGIGRAGEITRGRVALLNT